MSLDSRKLLGFRILPDLKNVQPCARIGAKEGNKPPLPRLGAKEGQIKER